MLSGESAVKAHLGIRTSDPARTTAGGWLVWQTRRTESSGDDAPTYKLYVSPGCSELQPAFAATAAAVLRSASFSWKVGADVYGLLRPDKIVVYFERFADLQETAASLGERLKGCPPHGVPFTAELGAAGLLSWGVDPPAQDSRVPRLERESWRLRICNRLAAALVLAKSSKQRGISASRFALERLRLDGIDPDSWTPC
jgi:hypothetical protein